MTPRFNYKRLFTISLIFERFGHINQFFFSPGILFQLLKFRPHVILTEGTSNILNNLLIGSYCLLTNTPYIWWDLGKIRGEQSQNIFRRILYPVIKYFYTRAHTILAYSTYGKEHFINEGVSAKNICVAGNTIRLDRHLSYQKLKIKTAAELKRNINFDKRLTFLTVGAIDKNKRFDVLISIFLKLLQKYKDIGLIIVGEGPELDTLKQLAGGTSNIYFAGAQFEEIGLYYMMSDVFVLPGLGGLAINEAMVYALPVISVPADGTEKDLILDYQTGILLENNSEKLIYSAMEWFIRNREKTISMGKAAKAHIVDNYNLPTMIDRIITVIHTATNR